MKRKSVFRFKQPIQVYKYRVKMHNKLFAFFLLLSFFGKLKVVSVSYRKYLSQSKPQMCSSTAVYQTNGSDAKVITVK